MPVFTERVLGKSSRQISSIEVSPEGSKSAKTHESAEPSVSVGVGIEEAKRNDDEEKEQSEPGFEMDNIS